MGKTTPCASCPKPLGLMAENVQAWEVFVVLATQLRVAGMGTITGIDLSAFEVVCNAKDVPQYERSDVMDKVLEISRIACKFWNEAKEE